MPPDTNRLRIDIPERACAVMLNRHVSYPLRPSLFDKIRDAATGTEFRTVICTADEAKELVRYFQRRSEGQTVAGDKDGARVCAVAADNARTALWLAGIGG